ncbi:MAG: hypothetical protein ACNA7L_09105, partial [Roseinatronobacter sp.]
TNAREWTASTLSQTEAEAGTATTRRAFTSERVRQAILGWWNGSADKTKLDGIQAGAQVNVATNLTVTGGTTAGPTVNSSTGSNVTLPTASAAASGVVTTGSQTFAGAKTFNNTVDVLAAVRSNIVAVSSTTIDCTFGNYFIKTISSNTTFTFTAAPSGRAVMFTLELTHNGGAVTWPGSVRWPGDTAPTLTTGKTHLFVFVTDDGGSRWRGAALVDYTN